MAADDSLIDVQEAARRLNRSPEQVRRYLREGRLKGHRVNNRWYVDATDVADEHDVLTGDISDELGDKLDRLLADLGLLEPPSSNVIQFKPEQG
jgi:excisionase family DNA binding protein